MRRRVARGRPDLARNGQGIPLKRAARGA